MIILIKISYAKSFNAAIGRLELTKKYNLKFPLSITVCNQHATLYLSN